MNHRLISPFLSRAWSGLVVVLATSTLSPVHATEPEPVKLVLDTDMGNDVDDVLALAMIHELQNDRRCELLAVTLSTPHALAGRFVDALNTLYGRPDIPIGVSPRSPNGLSPKQDYMPLVADRARYPHDFEPDRAPTALAVLRRTLAAAPDQGVVVVQVGAFNNLHALLQSGPDEFSALDGTALARRKVRLLSVMAGDFRATPPKRAEFNVRLDLPAALALTRDWPTPVVWSGWEIGAAVTFPASCIEHDFVPGELIREAYQRYRPVPHERPCWDLTSVWCAVWPATDRLGLSAAGTVKMDPAGFTRYEPKTTGRDRILTVTAEQAARLREDFAALIRRRTQKAGHRVSGRLE